MLVDFFDTWGIGCYAPCMGTVLAMELFRRSGIEPDVRYTTLENYTAINMVAEGLGISIMNEFITRSWKSNVAIVPIEPPTYISLGITLPSIENAPQAVREFIMFATDRLTKLKYK